MIELREDLEPGDGKLLARDMHPAEGLHVSREGVSRQAGDGSARSRDDRLWFCTITRGHAK